PCLQDTVNVDINAGKYLFKSSGYLVKFDGFTVLYEEGKDEEESDQKSLPKLIENELLKLKKITPNQHFTQPPMRYTEATLIKELEEKKIGRPSTYAPIISTVLQREYVIREKGKKTIMPTQLGEIITELMEDNFSNIIDMQFTAKMEDELDRIEAGNIEWVTVLENFYGRFSTTLSKAEKKLDGTKIKVPDVESDVVCDKCGKKMVVKSGRFGKFLACPGYPQCKNTKPIVTEMPGSCPKCGAKILQLKSKSGHKFFGCETGKSCGFMTWDEPTAENCPNCGKTLFKKSGKLYCATENCGFEKEKQRRGRKAKSEEKNEG
ncbi:MAG: topoisomerase DNA-binding C4 zinc finger domain-containing protein, partial [Clostridia bacterium]|nr:topoisomerase DNA-binding C4 zinc finger domain-containing protein [Clostridia bacterium]